MAERDSILRWRSACLTALAMRQIKEDRHWETLHSPNTFEDTRRSPESHGKKLNVARRPSISPRNASVLIMFEANAAEELAWWT